VIIYIARLDYIDYPTHPDKALQRLLVSVQTYLQEEKAKKEKERIEEERRRKAEITQQARTEKLQELREQIAQMENRKFEVEKEILVQEKSLVDLRNEKRIL
jgi:DNA-binding NtrC family response regulator